MKIIGNLIGVFCTLCVMLWAAPALAQHVIPRHEPYVWNRLSIEDFTSTDGLCIPVIFVNFENSTIDNEKAISTSNQNNWMKRLNDNCSVNHMGDDGSVNDYFRAQSYGRVNVRFEQIGTYTAPGAASNYTEYRDCARLASQAAKSLTENTDWGRYDCNGDGEVDCMLLIYAGHCDGDYSSRGATITGIYPHRGWIENYLGSRTKLDEKYCMQGYVMMNSLRDRSSAIAAVNTACHELSHGIFGLSDYYKNLNSYMGQYDAMCYGYRQMDYGAASDHCCDYCAFNRMLLGWLTPVEPTKPCHVVLHPLSQSPEAVVVFDPKDANHFYLLECRAALEGTWDAHLPAGGLIVTEIRWNRQTFENHSVNASARKNVQLICAATSRGIEIPNASYFNFDQKLIPYGIDGRDEIPGTLNAAFAKNSVTNIQVMRDGSVEFDFMGGGETLGVQDIAEPQQKVWDTRSYFDLMGRQVAHPQAGGLYIHQGRKILYRE